MKKYNDIGDLFRENFKDYLPKPSSKVWENIHTEVSKHVRINYKKVFYGAATVAVVTGVIIGAVYLKSIQKEEIKHDTTIVSVDEKHAISFVVEQQKEPVKVLKDNAAEQVIVVENQVESQKTIEQPEPIIENQLQVQEVIICQDEPFISNDQQLSVVQDLKINSKHESDAKNELAIIADEETVAKPSLKKVVVSKDTIVCENSTITLFIRNAKNIVWSNGNTTNDISVNVSQSQMFSVSFTDANGKDSTVYVFVRTVPCTELTIPSAFTPNGDGLNDEFKVFASGELSSFELIICNRNMKELFRSNSINKGWDGVYMNMEQPHGLYLYIIRYKDNFNQQIEKRGEFLLLRN
ncbi:MAG TPA: gliding motility-associated C-terminal domain-containing protein [Bacteroidales bacterium]|nr:gliding motility-associated C-terminal domain-containing protein [Bacteroidales bacterium]